MVGIIYTIVALSKQGVALKNIGNTVIVGMVKLCQKQGVALKKYREHGNSWNCTSLQMCMEQNGTGCQNRI